MSDLDNDILNSLIRASEGVALAMSRRHKAAEFEENVDYAKANLNRVTELVAQKRRNFLGSGQIKSWGDLGDIK